MNNIWGTLKYYPNIISEFKKGFYVMRRSQGYFIVFLLGISFFLSSAALSQSSATSSSSHMEREAVREETLSEERKAAENFIEYINEAQKELALRRLALAQQNLAMARDMIPIIQDSSPTKLRVTRVEFGGGIYANSLDQKKAYYPIETQALERLSISGGPRWVQNSRLVSDARIIYLVLDLADGKAGLYLDRAEKNIGQGDVKKAQTQLDELADKIININVAVPEAIQARDYITLADNYIEANNFFGTRQSLAKASIILDEMKKDDHYRSYRRDIAAIHKEIKDTQTAFANLDAEEIESAKPKLKKWQETLSGLVNE